MYKRVLPSDSYAFGHPDLVTGSKQQDVLQGSAFAAMTGSLGQIAHLAAYSADVMDGILRLSEELSHRIEETAHRSELLNKTLRLTQQDVKEAAEAAMISEPSTVERAPYTEKVARLLTQNSNDGSVAEAYLQCAEPPPLKVFDEEYGVGAARALYSNPDFFYDVWVREEENRIRQDRITIKKERKAKKAKRRARRTGRKRSESTNQEEILPSIGEDTESAEVELAFEEGEPGPGSEGDEYVLDDESGVVLDFDIVEDQEDVNDPVNDTSTGDGGSWNGTEATPMELPQELPPPPSPPNPAPASSASKAAAPASTPSPVPARVPPPKAPAAAASATAPSSTPSTPAKAAPAPTPPAPTLPAPVPAATPAPEKRSSAAMAMFGQVSSKPPSPAGSESQSSVEGRASERDSAKGATPEDLQRPPSAASSQMPLMQQVTTDSGITPSMIRQTTTDSDARSSLGSHDQRLSDASTSNNGQEIAVTDTGDDSGVRFRTQSIEQLKGRSAKQQEFAKGLDTILGQGRPPPRKRASMLSSKSLRETLAEIEAKGDDEASDHEEIEDSDDDDDDDDDDDEDEVEKFADDARASSGEARVSAATVRDSSSSAGTVRDSSSSASSAVRVSDVGRHGNLGDWEEHIDPSTGKKYYANRVTNQSSWEDPRKNVAQNAPSLDRGVQIPKPPRVPPLDFEPIAVLKPVTQSARQQSTRRQSTRRQSTRRQSTRASMLVERRKSTRVSMLVANNGGKRSSALMRRSIMGKRTSLLMQPMLQESDVDEAEPFEVDLKAQLEKGRTQLKHVSVAKSNSKGGGVDASIAKILANRSAVAGHTGSSSDDDSDDSAISFLSDGSSDDD